MPGWMAVPKDWVASFGDIVKFSSRVFGEIFRGRVFKFFGEALRQAGVLIVGSTIVIWSLCFIIGLQCGIEALEVMGISSMSFLCGTRLLASFMVLPFMYLAAVGAGFLASYLAVVQQIGEVSSGGFFLIFWMFQNPPDLLYSLIKGMAMATVIVLVGCYYGYTASGGPVGVGTATAKSMVLNTVMVHLVGMVGTQIFWGSNPRAPIGG